MPSQAAIEAVAAWELATLHEFALEFVARGWSLVKLKAMEKRPGGQRSKKWTKKSAKPEAFILPDEFTDPAYFANLGIMTGKMSENLVVVDYDCPRVRDAAKDFMPDTDCIEGRPGNPFSHALYRVTHIPDWLISRKTQAGVGGPQTLSFKGTKVSGKKGTLVDVLGTGAQFAAAPSWWRETEKQRQERGGRRRMTEQRVWHAFGEPATIPYLDLLLAIRKLVSEVSGGLCPYLEENLALIAQGRTPDAAPAPAAPTSLYIPTGEGYDRWLPPEDQMTPRFYQASRYLPKLPKAVSGRGGRSNTFRAACELVQHFDLPPKEAEPLMWAYNMRCDEGDRWSEMECSRMLARADRATKMKKERGSRYRHGQGDKIKTCLDHPNKPVYVGVDVARKGRNYIDLPSLKLAVIKRKPILSAAICPSGWDWNGKKVLICPPSTLGTNREEVELENRLTYLLRKQGAEVRSLHIEVGDGKRQTYNSTDRAVKEVVGLDTSSEALFSRQNEASALGKKLARSRRAQKRKRTATKKEAALAWLKKKRVRSLTEKTIHQGEQAGHSRRTLERAWKSLRKHSGEDSPSSLVPSSFPSVCGVV